MNISVVIVTFNRKELLLKTIESVKNQTFLCNRIIIIDNHSSDNTMEYLVDNNIIDLPYKSGQYLVSEKGNIYYCNLLENRGGAGGFSFGVQKAIEFNSDWIWLMDDDICPKHNTLETYISFIEQNKDKKISAIMGLRYYLDKPFTFETFKHNFTDWKISIKDELLDLNSIQDCSTLADFPFEGPIINGHIAKKIGPPNDDFFIIGDDTDYSIRLNMEGESYFLPSAKFDRLISPFSEKPKIFDWKQYYMLRNMIYINKLYAKNFKVRYFRPLLMLYLEVKKFVKIFYIERRFIYLKRIPKIFEAFFDGYFGRLGKKYIPGDF